MIHPQITGADAEVRYLCPTCSGEGWFSGRGEDTECPGCEGHRTVDADRARELHDQQRVDQRDVSSRVIERRLTAEGARQYDPDEGEAPCAA